MHSVLLNSSCNLHFTASYFKLTRNALTKDDSFPWFSRIVDHVGQLTTFRGVVMSIVTRPGTTFTANSAN